jgi:hypothetical protein
MGTGSRRRTKLCCLQKIDEVVHKVHDKLPSAVENHHHFGNSKFLHTRKQPVGPGRDATSDRTAGWLDDNDLPDEHCDDNVIDENCDEDAREG